MTLCPLYVALIELRIEEGNVDVPSENKSRRNAGEVLEAAKETAKVEQYWVSTERSKLHKPTKDYQYVEELSYLRIELIKMQEWIKPHRLKMCVIFEGRDAAGKGGMGTWAVVLSALCGRITGGRRNRFVRSELVQPRWCRASDGVLHGR
jgi:polyphosphate kinase 2 (PPK2 family)